MDVSSNPWLSLSAAQESETEEEETPEPQMVPSSGPSLPQQGVPAAAGLPRLRVSTPARVWWVSVHGGSGASTLASLVEGSAVARQAWPDGRSSADAAPRSVLVARTHAAGLLAARAAATEWAAGSTGVELLGLVLVADAPGRLPRPLKDLTKLVSGGVPRVWRVPWHDPWRLGEPPALEASPRPVRALAEEIDTLAPKNVN